MDFVNFEITNESTKKPTRGTKHSAGYDLYSPISNTIMPKERLTINLGLRLYIPNGYYGKLEARSGLAYKYGIIVLAGVIDSDYKEDIGLILYNSGDKEYTFSIGDRIGQIIFLKYNAFNLVNMNIIDDDKSDELDASIIRKGGFGSTGK
jgi:dUTP pyrophosphatase